MVKGNCVVGCCAWVSSFVLAGGIILAGETVRLEPIGRFDTGIVDESASEVIAYHAPSRTLYSVNCHDNAIDMISVADPESPRRTGQVKLGEFGSLPTSVAARKDIIATSVLSQDGREPGRVVLFTPQGEVLEAIQVGWHPDMVMFTPDGQYLIVANEGEPTPDDKTDGDGSVSVVTIPKRVDAELANVTVRDAGFRAWDDKPLPPGVRAVNRKIPFSRDAEPEGISISPDSQIAYISLQENNAVAIVDIPSATVTQIVGLHTKDHNQSGCELDVSGRADVGRLQTCPVQGMYQPDNILALQLAGQTYLVLADEGDARRTDTYEESIALKDAKLDPQRFPHASEWQSEAMYGSVLVSMTGDTDDDGDLDELLTFGSRSLSIITPDGRQVFDSGCRVERLIGNRLERQRRLFPDQPTGYETKKGPEPEGLAWGRIGTRTYVFLGLERDNGIVTFDVTDPQSALIVDYCNPADFAGRSVDFAKDVGPEGLVFISADQSPNGRPLLAVSNEVSGSVTIYQVRTHDFIETAGNH
ncbi:MAG: choice-of-anchor I family protein [Planctomycetales bacterium]|nr:choice-of-anchor I family protein [Planctomycetales bacterium]